MYSAPAYIRLIHGTLQAAWLPCVAACGGPNTPCSKHQALSVDNAEAHAAPEQGGQQAPCVRVGVDGGRAGR